MLKLKSGLIILTTFLLLVQIGCTQYPAIQEPDAKMFEETVHSAVLIDSLQQGKLTAGMPRFVVSQLFKNWNDGLKEIKIPVASPGSKQRLEEEEGWGRKYVDPDVKVFLDEYETSKGKLYVWYQRPDFYSMNVAARDTLCIFLEDTIMCSAVKYLNNSKVLTVKDSLPEIPLHTSLYAEIHYNDHPWRVISYWYNVEVLNNARSFKLGDTNYELYPIELIELNNEPVSSFKWREVNQNEN